MKYKYTTTITIKRNIIEAGECGRTPVISSVGPSFLSDEGPTLETLDFTIRIGSTPTFSYFDLIYTYSFGTNSYKFETII